MNMSIQMEEFGDYRLRCELRSHNEDVRCVCITDTGLATGSRDKTIKLWKEAGPTSFALTSTFVGHTDYVSALTYAPEGPSCPLPGGALVSGSRDTTVAVWDVDSAAAVQQLKGHQYQVASVAVTFSGEIISASLDKTLRVWHGGKCTAVLEGHSAAVLCVAVLPGGESIASGSGDCTVKIWSLADGSCTATIKAHADTVRGMAVFPGVGLVTASHDCTLKVWTLAGEVIAEMAGHTALVYCTDVSLNGELIASGSEDNTAKLWLPNGQVVQTIEHPGCVWAVAFLPNGDLVTACADGVARIWSRDPQLQAPASVVEAYLAEVNAFKEAATAKNDSGGGEAAGGLPPGLSLSDPSVLQAPGDLNGDIKIISEGKGAVAYSWDASTAEWERIGEVVSGVDDATRGNTVGGDGSRKWHSGREWDYVFDVDVADGAPPLKLAMDSGDNPYLVAEKFIEEYELPPGYKEQIVEFILQNTQKSVAVGRGTGAHVDPYNGASAYVPPPSQGHQHGGPVGGGYSVTGGGADPFTGGSGVATRHTPAKEYLFFDASPPIEGLRKKILEFNAELLKGSEDTEAAQDAAVLSHADIAGPLEALLTAVGSPIGERSFDASASTALLSRMMSWPAPKLFPALDVARVAMLDADVAQALATQAAEPSLESPLGSLGHAIAVACSSSPPTPASQQTALRCACNSFAQAPLAAWARSHVIRVLTHCASCAASPVKNVRLAAATLLLNVALMLNKLPGDELQAKTALVETARMVFTAHQTLTDEDEEVLYRALVALGTVLPEHSQVRIAAREMGLLFFVDQLQGKSSKVGEAAKEVCCALKL